MDNITYQETYLVKSSEVNHNQLLKLSSLLKIIQDLATNGSEILDAGKEKTIDRGYLWVFSKLEINISRLPSYQEIINLSTYPNELMHFIYPRTFLIKDKNDNLLIEATSLWCLLNAKTRKIALPSKTGIVATSNIKSNPIPKINVKDVEFREKRTVKYTDIDLNRHLNNTRYLDYICDLYDSNFFDSHKIKKLNIAFHQEVKENKEVSIYASSDNTYFLFEVDDKKVFECNIEYQEKC